MSKMNKMKEIRMEKLTLNVGAGTNQDLLKKSIALLKNLTGVEPVKTVTQKRIPGWGLRPGLPIGCKITLRGKSAEELLERLLRAKENKLKETSFDNDGNISFGIPEYIDIPGMEYDSNIGIIGFEVAVTLERPGYRVKKRKRRKAKVGKTHKIKHEEAITFFKEKYNIEIINEQVQSQ